MNTRNTLKNVMAAILPCGVLLFISLIVASCNKTENPGPSAQTITQGDLIRTFSNIKINKPSGGGNFTQPSSGFNPGEPGEGQNFGSPSAGQNFGRASEGANFSGPNQGFTVNTSSLSLGGGSFAIDGETYELSLVFCSGSAFNPFGDLGSVSGATLLIGLAFDGNIFELFADEDEEISFLGGIAVIITDENPDGTYRVVNFDEDAELGNNEAFVWAFISDTESSSLEDASTTFYVSVSGGEVLASNGQLDILDLTVVKIDLDSQNGDIPVLEEASLSANIECSDIVFEEDNSGGVRIQ